MDTRNMTAEYRQAHWAGIIRERNESGMSIKAYCEATGIHENTYYYWQKKLREIACQKIITKKEEYQNNPKGVPNGWSLCKIEKEETTSEERKENTIEIQIGKCRINITNMDKEIITTIFQTMVSVC